MLHSQSTSVTSRGKILLFIIIPVLSLFMHFHVFNTDLVGIHVWRQTQTQTVIDNFYKEDFNILNPRINCRGNGTGIFRMEFPIMQWLFACFYKLFGSHLIISRILTFITGLFSIWGMYRLVAAIFHKEKIALLAAWCFTFSPVFYYYTMNPLPDNFALCTAIWGMAFFFEWVSCNKATLIIFSAIFLSLATLAKLPFIIYLTPISIYFIQKSVTKKISLTTAVLSLVPFILCLVPPLLWYANVVGSWDGNGIVQGILSVKKNDIPALLDIMQFNLVSTLPELLINYGSFAFFLAGFWFLIKNRSYRNPLMYVMASWGIVVILYFLFEMNMIAKTHDYYLFPFLPVLFILVAYGANQLINTNVKAIKVFVLVALCIIPVTAYLRINHRWNTADPGFNSDIYNHKTELQNAVPCNALCIVGNDESTYIDYYYLNKKGWTFNNDNLSPDILKAMIQEGAKYLYSDSRKIESDSALNKHFDKRIAKYGTVNVFLLK